MKVCVSLLIVLIFGSVSCKNGVEKSYFNNGLVRIEKIKLGEHEYHINEYDSLGVLKYTAKFMNDIMHGEVKKFYDSGKLEDAAFYELGILDGERRFYKNNGDLEQISLYENGIGYYHKYFENDSVVMEVVSPIVRLDSSKLKNNNEHFVFQISLPFDDLIDVPYNNFDVTTYFYISTHEGYDDFPIDEENKKVLILNKSHKKDSIEFYFESEQEMYLKSISYYGFSDSLKYFNVTPLFEE